MATGDWIELNKPWHEVCPGYEKDSPLKVGMQIEVAPAGAHPKSRKVDRYLIGDVNELGGVCDDCKDFDRNAVVRRYRVLVETSVLEEG